MRELNAFSRTNGTVVGNIYSLTNTDGNVAGAYHPVVEFIDDELDKYRAFSNKLSARAYSDSMRKESVEMVLIQTFPADGTALASFVSGNLIYPVPN